MKKNRVPRKQKKQVPRENPWILSAGARSDAEAVVGFIGSLIGTAQVVVDVMRAVKPPAASQTIDVEAEVTTNKKEDNAGQ